jgi:hypothetical protein
MQMLQLAVSASWHSHLLQTANPSSATLDYNACYPAILPSCHPAILRCYAMKTGSQHTCGKEVRRYAEGIFLRRYLSYLNFESVRQKMQGGPVPES